nr:hypothetical protein [Tanacetum cinerariifolium]
MSFVTSVSRSTTLEGEVVVGIVGPLYAFPLRVVIPFKSSFGLVMVLHRRVPKPEDEASQLAIEELGLDEPEFGNPGLDKLVLAFSATISGSEEEVIELDNSLRWAIDIDQLKAYNVPTYCHRTTPPPPPHDNKHQRKTIRACLVGQKHHKDAFGLSRINTKDVFELVECLAPADLGASINLMPLSIWKKLSLPKLTPTRMILELADRSTTRPAGIAEDVFVKVGKFHFLTDFVVVDFVVDPWIPLILGRPFLRTGRSLIDVYGEALTLRVDNEAITFKGGDFILEEIKACLTSKSILSGIDDTDFDLEGDIRRLEKLLNDDPSSSHLPPKELTVEEIKTIKSSIDEPPELELKDLPSHLEYAFLKGTDKLPVIISKELKDEEKYALLKVLKSHKPAIVWKISDIKDGFSGYFQILIDPQDQEKTTFTYPYGIFSYRRMPFGLCNAPGTFQRRMMAIFHDMIKATMKVFMEDFSVFKDSFSSCLSHLDKMLKRSESSHKLDHEVHSIHWVELYGDHPRSEGQSLHASRPSKLCAQAQSVDDMPFHTRAYTKVICGSKTVSDTVLKHDLCELVIVKVRTVITNDSTGSSKPSKERFREFANNSGVVGGERFRFNPFRQEENPPEQSHLEIFFSKEIFEGGVIRIHNAFVQDEDRTYGKVACIAHKLKGKVLIGGNQDWSFCQFFLECLKGFNTLFGEEERGIFLKNTGHRPGYLQKILYESSIEAGMTKETTDTLDGSGMR